MNWKSLALFVGLASLLLSPTQSTVAHTCEEQAAEEQTNNLFLLAVLLLQDCSFPTIDCNLEPCHCTPVDTHGGAGTQLRITFVRHLNDPPLPDPSSAHGLDWCYYTPTVPDYADCSNCACGP